QSGFGVVNEILYAQVSAKKEFALSATIRCLRVTTM
ncbi:MAG: hypothetical protein ACI9OH_003754, partial [Oleispira sp.]